MKINFNKIIGDESQFSLEHRILNILLVLGVIICLLVSIINYFLGLGVLMVLTVSFGGIVLVCLYYLSIIKKQYTIPICFGLIVVFILTPTTWIFNAGTLGAVPYFIILFSSMIVTSLFGLKKYVFIFCLMAMTITLIILEYKYPLLVRGYGGNIDRFADISFGFIITIISNVILFVIILNNYNMEHKRVREFLTQIEKQKLELEFQKSIKATNEHLQQEIIERKRAEEVIRESEARFRRITDNMLDMIRQTNVEGVIQYASPSHKNILGYDAEDLLGKSILEFVHPDDRNRVGLVFQMSNSTFLAEKIEYRFRHANGHYLWVDTTGNLLFDDDGLIIGAVFCSRDITDSKRAEQEMARLDRLNLVGEMAAGIGHEIRNPMTVVRGFIQLLGYKKEYAKDKEHFELMIEELDRANSIITSFISLAKNRVVEYKMQKLDLIVKTIFPLLQADAMLSDKYIKMELEEVPDLSLDEKEIRQLILNLVRNGLEAMSPGGRLTIKTFSDNNEVVVAVQDQGKGIEPDICAKLGTPFFTTKENGTGLGLATCYSIAARHNAKIEIETGLNGTTFFVRFKQANSRQTGTVLVLPGKMW